MGLIVNQRKHGLLAQVRKEHKEKQQLKLEQMKNKNFSPLKIISTQEDLSFCDPNCSTSNTHVRSPTQENIPNGEMDTNVVINVTQPNKFPKSQFYQNKSAILSFDTSSIHVISESDSHTRKMSPEKPIEESSSSSSCSEELNSDISSCGSLDTQYSGQGRPTPVRQQSLHKINGVIERQFTMVKDHQLPTINEEDSPLEVTHKKT